MKSLNSLHSIFIISMTGQILETINLLNTTHGLRVRHLELQIKSKYKTPEQIQKYETELYAINKQKIMIQNIYNIYTNDNSSTYFFGKLHIKTIDHINELMKEQMYIIQILNNTSEYCVEKYVAVEKLKDLTQISNSMKYDADSFDKTRDTREECNCSIQ